MPAASWSARAAAVAAVTACGLLTAPAAWAHPAAPVPGRTGPVAGRAAPVAVAAGQRAPVVTDSGGLRSKAGLAAPALSGPMARAAAAKQARVSGMTRLRAAARQSAGAGGKCTSAACRAGLPAARDLAGDQRPQRRNYYCGPATVAEMLGQLGVNISQGHAAQLLGTNLGNGTDWSDRSGYPVPRVLNAEQHRNAYVAVALPWTPTRAQTQNYETDLVTDINHGRGVPLAGNAYEVAGGPHLAGNPPDQTVFHWIDIRGYGASGAVTDYEDSVHGASSIGWAAGVPAYSSMSSAAMVAILGARGYVW